MSQKLTNESSYQNILYYSRIVDEQNWHLEDKMSLGSLSTSDIATALNVLQVTQQQFSPIRSMLSQDAAGSGVFLDQKIQRFGNRLLSFQPVGPTVSHPQFINSAPFTPQPAPPQNSGDHKQPVSLLPQPSARVYNPLSFAITEADQKSKQQLSNLQILDRVSYLLREGNDQQAIDEFCSITSIEIQKAVYEALWIVRDRPMGNNPIAHGNFGEVSFKNLDKRCASTPQQKRDAVELAKTRAALHEIVHVLEKQPVDMPLMRQTFDTLPTQVQGELFGKHWEMSGRPTDKSPEEHLRKIGHHDFGKVSLLGLEERCDVPADKKAETFEAYLSDYSKKIDTATAMIQRARADWSDKIDRSHLKGNEKNDAKRTSLDQLANKIIPLFVDTNKTPITKPTPKNSAKTGQPGTAYLSLAEAYVEKYPCLRPFFFQLMPNLTLANDPFGNNVQIATQGSRKSSQPNPPDLANMEERERKEYRTKIINETLQTLHDGYYINSKGQKITLTLQPAIDSLCCQSKSGGTDIRDGAYNTKIFLDKKDCLTVTRLCVENGLNPILVDAASNGHFGGGYQTGAGAQEENMCRRSGLPIAADPKLSFQSQNFYPLTRQGEHAGLYVSNVPVFRGEEIDGYPYLDQPFETAVAIMAAYNFNEAHQKKNKESSIKKLEKDLMSGELRIPQAEAIETEEKLRTIFQMAQTNGHNSVVLVPLGCGAFCNPPKHVAEIMMRLIINEFPHSFKEVHISIIDDHNTGKAHNRRGNYVEFKEVIEKLSNRAVLDEISATLTLT
jgi:uncharacterized protein (TIGR02452 family)